MMADAYLLINAFHFHQVEDYRMLAAIGQPKSANYGTVELCLLFVLFVIEVGRESGDLPAPFYVCGARKHRSKGTEDFFRSLLYPLLAPREKGSHYD